MYLEHSINEKRMKIKLNKSERCFFAQFTQGITWCSAFNELISTDN